MKDSTKLVIPFGNLNDILDRLYSCCAVLDVIRSDMGNRSNELTGALCGATDLLKSIIRDFQADVDGAEVDTDGV